jgi:hypothetical protein
VELEPASDSRLRRLTLSYRWRIQFYVIDPSLSPRYGCGQAVLRGWIRHTGVMVVIDCVSPPRVRRSVLDTS